jgi:hypothetical protein
VCAVKKFLFLIAHYIPYLLKQFVPLVQYQISLPVPLIIKYVILPVLHKHV